MEETAPVVAAAPRALRRLLGLSPFGPIFGKELRTTARRRRSYVLRVVYLGGLLLVLLSNWAATSSRFYYGSISAQVQAQAKLGTDFFFCFTMFSVIAMAAIGPVLTSTAIGSERLAKTLPVLLMTPINAWQVVAGKLFSRLLVALTLLGLSLPVLALVRLLGGVELWQMVGAVCVCAVTALFAAALGLLFSAFINRAYAVILLSYVTLLLVYGFVPFVLIEGFGLRTMVTLRFFAAINPFFCSGMIAEPRMFVYAGAMWTVCVTLHLGATAGLVMLAAAVLRRVSRREGERSSVQTPETQPDAPAAGRSGFVRGAIRARRWRLGAGRGVWDQPVLWREARRSLLGKPWHSLVAGAATVGLLAVTYATLGAEGDLGDRWTQQFFACVFNGLFWLLAAVLSATSIAQEKESDTWTLLLTTPLGGHAVVWGKVAGLCRRAAWPLLLFAAHFVMFWVSGILPLRSAAVALWVIVTFNSIWVATGMYLSLRLRKVTLAVIVNLMLAVVAYLGMLAVLVIVGELGYFDDLYKFVSYYVPYYYLTAGLFDGWPDWQNGVLVMPGDVRVTQPQFDLILAAVGVAHLVVAALVLWWTAATFDDIVGRAPRGAVGRTSRPAPKTGPYFSAPANL